MGLPASQHRVLAEIEMALQGSDPRLASMFTIFTRLHASEEMPRLEQLRVRAARLAGRVAAVRQRLMAPNRSRLRTALFFPFALATMASAVLLSVAFPPVRCAAAPRAQRTAAVARVIRCPPPSQFPANLGR
jgi:hypothetical protein